MNNEFENEIDIENDPLLTDPDSESAEPEEKEVNVIEKAGEANLIGHILKCPEVAEMAATALPVKALGVKSHRIIAEIANFYWKKYGKLIPPNILELGFVKKIEKSKSRVTDYEDFQSVTNTQIESAEYYTDAIVEIAKRHGIALATDAMRKSAANNEPIDFDAYFKAIDNTREIGRKTEEMKLYDVIELSELPEMEWMVANHFPTTATGCVYGPSGSCKTFYCLDMACCIASGLPFLGKHEVKQRKVCYINSEGKYNLCGRLNAWCEGHNYELKDLLKHICFLPSTCNITELSQCKKLIEKTISKIGGFDVLFIDTLSRNFGDGDTDNNQDMRLYLRGVDYIREQTEAAVISIHHTGHNGDRETGAKSLRNYCDTSIQVSSTTGAVEVICKKQKDLEPFRTYKLDRQKSGCSIWLSPIEQEDINDKEDQATILDLIPILPLSTKPTKENTVSGISLRDHLGIASNDRKKLTRLLAPLLNKQLISLVYFGNPAHYYRIEEVQ